MGVETDTPPAVPDENTRGSAVRLRDGFFTMARHRLPIVALGTLLALLTWPIARLQPVGGIDASWQAGMAMAFQDALRWGVEVVFTYGPLGFLISPQLFDPRLGALAWLFVALAHVALFVVIVWLSVRSESPIVGMSLAIVGCVLATRTQPTGAVELISLVACIELLRRDHAVPHRLSRRVALSVMVALGALSAFLFLVKLNDGIAIVVLVLVTSAALTERRSAFPIALGSAGFALVVLWLGAGQQLQDLVAYVTTGREIVTGYSMAMGLDDRTWDGQSIGVAIAVGLIGWVLWRAVRPWRREGQVGAFIVVSWFCFLAYKEGFVRHSGGGFFEAVALITVWILPWPRIDRDRRILVLAALVLAFLGTTRINPFGQVTPGGIGLAIEQFTTIVDTQGPVATIEGAREEMRARYAIPASMLAAMEGRTVHVEPYETAVLWAYPQLAWKPLPVMQPYVAYTTALDRLNAEALASDSGPGSILRSVPTSIDGRHPFFESPLAFLEEACHFVELGAIDRWQLLVRGPTRCGEPQPMTSVIAAPGELIDVPSESRADRLIVAHIDGIEAGPLAALRAVVDKSPTWLISLDAKGAYRLVPGTVGGPLILSSPDSLGWSAIYRPPKDVRSFVIGTGSDGALARVQPEVELTIRFESIPFGPPP